MGLGSVNEQLRFSWELELHAAVAFPNLERVTFAIKTISQHCPQHRPRGMAGVVQTQGDGWYGTDPGGWLVWLLIRADHKQGIVVGNQYEGE